MNALRAAALLAVLATLVGCKGPESYDYRDYLAHPPRSILVLPPLDETPEVEACYGWLSSITVPLAEAGYYVFPVALVDRILRENGLPTPGEMHQVSLKKLDEVFGADAVLYVTVTSWGTSYEVIDSKTRVSVQAQLIDLKTGSLLWQGRGSATESGSVGGGGIFGRLISSAVNQVVTTISDPSRGLATEANGEMLGRPRRGLLLGPYHPDHEQSFAEARDGLGE